MLLSNLNPLFVLIAIFFCVFGFAFLFVLFLELKNGRTGFLRGLLAVGIAYGLACELGLPFYSPFSLSIVCAILFSASWVVEAIGRREKSMGTVEKN